MPSVDIREATIDDSSLILRFVRELAIYEKAEHEVIATEADIKKSLFAQDSTTHAVICSRLGKHGLYLEDLYVSPEYRGVGAGKALLKHLATIAVATQCGRFEWSVLDWNEPAINFYQSIGAKPQDEWVGYRLAGPALEHFANS